VSQKKFFSEIAKKLDIESEGGDDTEVIRRGPYKFKINHSKNKVSITK
jgi:hypothetical protein